MLTINAELVKFNSSLRKLIRVSGMAERFNRKELLNEIVSRLLIPCSIDSIWNNYSPDLKQVRVTATLSRFQDPCRREYPD